MSRRSDQAREERRKEKGRADVAKIEKRVRSPFFPYCSQFESFRRLELRRFIFCFFH